MRAAVVPAPHGKWEVRDVPTPAPGAGQVLIKIHASGLCYTDVHITESLIPTQFPRTLGHEPVGEIVATGAGVTTRQVGDRVGVPWVQAIGVKIRALVFVDGASFRVAQDSFHC